MNQENPSINIEVVENGYIVTVIVPEKPTGPNDVINQIMPMYDKLINKATGEDWKNNINDEIESLVNTPRPKPVRQFVCYQWIDVLHVLEENKMFP